MPSKNIKKDKKFLFCLFHPSETGVYNNREMKPGLPRKKSKRKMEDENYEVGMQDLRLCT